MGDDELRLTESEIVYSGRLISVRRDQLESDRGRLAQREVVEHPGAVAIIATSRDEEVILVRQFRHAIGEYLLELPAGVIDPGENREDTARRELLEETGYAADVLTPIGSVYSSPGYSDEIISLFFAPACEQLLDGPRPGEPVNVVLVPLDQAVDLIDQGAGVPVDGKLALGLAWLRQHQT